MLTNTPGLSAARQWYLYKEIREFCDDEHNGTVVLLHTAEEPIHATSLAMETTNFS